MATGMTTDQHDEGGDGRPDPGNNRVPSLERFDQLRSALERASEAVEVARRLTQQRAQFKQPELPGRRPLVERRALHDARFRALVTVTGHVVWSTDVHGRMTDLQPAWMRFTGQTLAQLRACDGWGWSNALHPDDRDESVQLLQDALRSEGVFEHTARVQHRLDGAVQWRHMLM
ncbi:MAG TPA: PAS domain S-box protein, partial [Gemmatimonas sp.]|nr:PAS domain S-box protein [Gemmatimonas sp.]